MDNIAFDGKLVWDIIQVAAGLIAACLVFMLRKVFVKKEVFQELEKRVQTLEQTYVKQEKHDELDKRLAKIEQIVVGMPELVQKINDELIKVSAASNHVETTVSKLERSIELINQAAMRSSNGS